MKQETAKQTKEIVTKPIHSLTSFNEDFADEAVDTSDIKIAKVLLMQGSSELVKAKKFAAGDMVRSTDSTLLAKDGDTVNLVIFKKWKSWRNMELVGKRFEWRGEEPMTKENALAEWEYISKDGKQMRRDKTFNFYAILEDEAKSGFSFPIKLSFTRGTIRAGEILADLYERHVAYKKAPYMTTVKLTSKLFTNKNGDSYNIFEAIAGNESSAEAQKEASKWVKITKNTVIQEHVVNESEDATTATNEF